jgi:surface antigen
MEHVFSVKKNTYCIRMCTSLTLPKNKEAEKDGTTLLEFGKKSDRDTAERASDTSIVNAQNCHYYNGCYSFHLQGAGQPQFTSGLLTVT